MQLEWVKKRFFAQYKKIVVKRIFEYSNIRSIGHIRIFFKSHLSIRDVTSNAVHVHTCTPNTVQCSAYSLPVTLYCMFAHVRAHWTANVANSVETISPDTR